MKNSPWWEDAGSQSIVAHKQKPQKNTRESVGSESSIALQGSYNFSTMPVQRYQRRKRLLPYLPSPLPLSLVPFPRVHRSGVTRTGIGAISRIREKADTPIASTRRKPAHLRRRELVHVRMRLLRTPRALATPARMIAQQQRKANSAVNRCGCEGINRQESLIATPTSQITENKFLKLIGSCKNTIFVCPTCLGRYFKHLCVQSKCLESKSQTSHVF